ncbi:MAG TPA: hypothetical protein VFQ65_19345, partial [Kofleriaceae bacterium]|nr:hypothetical protein [Kofleriaceae bacterium]
MKNLVLVILLALCGISAADGSGAPVPASPALDAAKQACTAAMNDPKYSESLQNFIDQRLDLKTIEAHNDAFHHIQKNER